MRPLHLNDLLRLTRLELLALYRMTLAELAGLAEGSAERRLSLANMSAIRAALAHKRGPTPG